MITDRPYSATASRPTANPIPGRPIAQIEKAKPHIDCSPIANPTTITSTVRIAATTNS